MIIHLGIRSLFVAIGGSISKKKIKDFLAQGEGEGRSPLVYHMKLLWYVHNTIQYGYSTD